MPRTAVVTGATRGIGRAIAWRLAQEGWSLVLVGRSRGQLEALRDALSRAHGVRVVALTADLALPRAAQIIAHTMKQEELAPDLLVNNAGQGDYGRFVQRDAAAQDAMIQVNVGALTALTRWALPGMLERGSGVVVNIASTAALRPGPNLAVYSATKAYVLNFTESLACELAGTGVRVLAVCPGPTQTGFRQASGMTPERSAARSRQASAEEVADFALDVIARHGTVFIHGWRNRAMAAVLRLLPRQLQARILLAQRERQSSIAGNSRLN